MILAGTSAGGYGAFRFLIDYPEAVDATLLMAPAYTPSDEELDMLDALGERIWYMIGYRDELVRFDVFTAPILTKLLRMPNVEVTLLDWVKNGDKGVASINFGIEMGQHCICVAAGGNLLYDDGTPYDISHPDGVTGWIRSVVANP